jgi:glycosyltransferase involved in cell wall biosynthesis
MNHKLFSSSHYSPVRLSVITQFYPPDYASTGQLIEELVHQLGQQNFRVQVFTGQPGYAFSEPSAPVFEQAENVSVRRSRTARLWPKRIRGKAINGLLFCLRAVLFLLRTAFQTDVLLFTTAPPYLSILGYLMSWVFGIPYVCLLYDIYPDIAVQLNVVPKHHILVRFWHWVNGLVWGRSQHIIVLSECMKQRILEQHPQLATKVEVIHTWTDPDWIQPLPKHENWFAQQYDLVRPFTVLYSGNMGRCHDMDTILDTIIELDQEPIQFVFIGGGAKYESLMQTVHSLGLQNCLFLPYQDKKNLPYSLTACDLSLVSVSGGMKGLVAPSKLYGCLAAGRPLAVICEPHSYLHQMILDGKCGQTFQSGESQPLANFIRQLAHHPQMVAEMGHAGRQYCRTRFTLQHLAMEYARVLRASCHVPQPQGSVLKPTVTTAQPVMSSQAKMAPRRAIAPRIIVSPTGTSVNHHREVNTPTPVQVVPNETS